MPVTNTGGPVTIAQLAECLGGHLRKGRGDLPVHLAVMTALHEYVSVPCQFVALTMRKGSAVLVLQGDEQQD